MARGIEIKMNPAGVRELLRDPSVTDLQRRGEAIARRADANLASPGHEARSHVGANRARVIVVTVTNEARYAEARHRNLTRAIDAGRG